MSKTIRLASISARMLADKGVTSAASARVAEALKLLDYDNANSVPYVLHLLGQSVEATNRDPELSAEGKRNRIAAATGGRLGNIANFAKTVARLEAEYRRDADEAVPLPKADAADVLLDLALVAHVKASEPIPSKLVQMSERVRLAVARTPAELSGLKPEVQAQVRGSLMDPHKAVQLGAEADALGAARRIVQGAIDELAPGAGWTPAELVQHFGTQWRLPGIVPSLAERLATEAATEGAGGES